MLYFIGGCFVGAFIAVAAIAVVTMSGDDD